MLIHKFQKIVCFSLLLENRFANLLHSVMNKGVVKLQGIISSRKANDPIFVINNIKVLTILILIETELSILFCERLSNYSFIFQIK